jgi:hypothetical protein
MSEKELSFGEKAVGLTLNNPSDDAHVTEIKKGFAAVIDVLNDLRDDTISGEKKRLYSAAITEAQIAQMLGVKGVTWRDD